MTLSVKTTSRLDRILLVLGLIGAVLFFALYDRVFPTAAIDLTLSRDEIAQHAIAYLGTQGYAVGDYESAVSFGEDTSASYYLQRTVGVPETNRRIHDDQLPIWSWSVRWFKPLQQEEFSARLLASGEVIGFSHTIAETAPGAQLDEASARVVAETYLVQDRQWTLADLESISASAQTKPGGRVDHYFEWKRRGYAVGDGDWRVSVSVQGDRVGGYYQWLRVPEAFQRQYASERGQASFINNFSFTIGFYGFAGLALLLGAVAIWRGLRPWRAALRPALLVAAVSLLASLNWLPLYKQGYSTTQDYTLFWVQNIFGELTTVVYDGALVFLVLMGGLYVSKLAWPQRDMILPRGEDRSIALARSAARGLVLAGAHSGYVILFYFFATQVLGGWSPVGAPNAANYATPWPFLGPLYNGLIPATHEELLFRLVGVAVILLALRRRWLALLIPGALWAFAHLGYVRDPIYFRGIELTIAAVFIYGLIFWRYGLVTTIVMHFAYNATLGALPMVRSGNPVFVVSGVIVFAVMLIPIVPGAIKALRHRNQPKRPQPQIVGANRSDAVALAAFHRAAMDWAAVLDDPAVAVVCLKAGEDVIGAAVARIEADGLAQVQLVQIAAAWRRQYWGSRLLDELRVQLLARGGVALQATVPHSDKLAIGFWASQGWHEPLKVFRQDLRPSKPQPWRLRVRQFFADGG